MPARRYDLIAVGGGAAGLVASAGAAGLGARVALVERARLGGECLWTGCVPSKALLACARAARDARRAASYGIDVGDVAIDFRRVRDHVRAAQARIEPHDSAERFRGLGVDVVIGTARFVGPRTLDVDGRRLEGRNIVVATGSRPDAPQVPGLQDVPYLTNETIFELDERPASLLVLGAGPVGLELAQAFAGLGSAVTVVEAAPRVLPREDAEIASLLQSALEAEGIRLLLGHEVRAAARTAAGVALDVAGPRGEARLEATALLVATGRRSNHADLEPAAGGVDVGRDGIVVDDRLRTTAERVWAAGDATGILRFTHVADYQARLVVRNALFPGSGRADYAAVPRVTFTEPELGRVGLTEEEARERHGDAVRVWRHPLHDLDRAVADGCTTGLVKLVADRRGRLLGAHVLGPRAGEVVVAPTLALRHGLGLGKLAATVFPYPTYGEAVKQAADAHVRARLTGFTRRLAAWLATH
ncbi:MAG TPA: FAD-dependent oxidoreductase [Longimicrobiales bacterium]|nr:FAD-dependent oxidoreductase [Longimicrobiales bacterium]